MSNKPAHTDGQDTAAKRPQSVVLVLPPFAIEVPDEGPKSYGKMRPWPPLGLGMLAAVLRQRGHRPVILDSQARRYNLAQVVDAAMEHNPDILGISALTACDEPCYELARLVRERKPDCLIILGGPHATCFPEESLLDCPAVDLVVPGEAEYILADIVDARAAGTPPETVAGLFHRNAEGKPVGTGPVFFHKDLDVLPFPARDLFDRHLYKPLVNQSRRTPAANVITARGCPWARCAFCYNGGDFRYPYRRRTPENVLAEIEELTTQYGYREITFWDDDFTHDNDWVMRFCQLLEDRGIDITWSVQARVSSVTPELLHRMAAAGCYNIFFGLESGNQELLNLIRKGLTLDMARKTVAAARQAGMEVRAAFMFGLPTETPEMSRKTIRFACELNLDYVVFVPFHPQRGTCLEHLALKQGRIVPVERFNMVTPTYCPDTYPSPEALDRMVRYAYLRYYLRPRFMLHTFKRLRYGRDVGRIWEGLRHLAVLLFRQG